MKIIRNFAIIAHVDHGKSTLADRFLELTGVVKPGSHDAQMLDRNPISRERGITIKLAPVRMEYNEYILNLIDTPGHVDFSYEVDRTLACVEGVVLLVDATQGVQAQTISNAHKAIEKNLVIIPVLNKIDLPSADVAITKQQLIDFLGIQKSEVFEISAKTGHGTHTLLEEIIHSISPPKHEIVKQSNTKFSALIFDSYYDSHRGVIAFIRIFEGEIKKGVKAKLFATNEIFEVLEVGYFTPELVPSEVLAAGEIGYVVTNLKDIHKVRVGDTIMDVKNSTFPIGAYKKVKPIVYASVFTTDTNDYLNLKRALEKLYLNDSSLEFVGIHSKALGAGFRVGFLGLLHADVVRERLEREFSLNLVLTPPQVDYLVENKEFLEPYSKVFIITPQKYSGAVMQLCEQYRARFITMDNKNQITLIYEMPLSEMISDFFDRLKSVSSGYASLDWEFLRHEKVKADKLTILLNGDPVDEFSEIVVEERAFEKGEALVNKLKDIIPRQQYEVKIQAQYKGKVIASTRISPFRKDVLVKSGKVLGSGDVGRRKKLLERQKEGKKKLKMIGKVEIPKEAFIKLFNRSGSR
ncbi:GTP-binding protein [Candidatus Roizmanbacteria bacterium]|nr:GTP-binding protein [Candidatus Roizmanbacteria bacterium]